MSKLMNTFTPASSAVTIRLATSIACFVALSALVGVADAQNRIWKCPDELGNLTYQNSASKGCEEIRIQPLTTIPAPPQRGRSSSSPSSFPKVGTETQKERDSDRKQILQAELKREQGKLDELKSEYNNGEPERRGDEKNYQKYLDRVEQLKQDIARSEGTIGSLQREVDAAR